MAKTLFEPNDPLSGACTCDGLCRRLDESTARRYAEPHGEVMMDFEEDDQKSRSQIKREFRALKELVKELIELPSSHLDRIPMSQRNRDEIASARELSRSALQRQLRFLVRRIEASEDIDAIRNAVIEPPPLLEDDETPDEVEQQAQELIAGDNDVLGQFIDVHPELDHRKLRRFVRAARKERKRGLEGPRPAAEALVDYLRS